MRCAIGLAYEGGCFDIRLFCKRIFAAWGGYRTLCLWKLTMADAYEPPEIYKKAFTCPHCDAYAAMDWSNLGGETQGSFSWTPVWTASCHHCRKLSIWLNEEGYGIQEMIHPNRPLPHCRIQTCPSSARRITWRHVLLQRVLRAARLHC